MGKTRRQSIRVYHSLKQNHDLISIKKIKIVYIYRFNFVLSFTSEQWQRVELGLSFNVGKLRMKECIVMALTNPNAIKICLHYFIF